MIITPAQCRAARFGLNKTRKDIAALSGVSERTITDFEREARSPINATLQALRGAFEREEIEFGDDGWMRVPTAPPSLPGILEHDGKRRKG